MLTSAAFIFGGLKVETVNDKLPPAHTFLSRLSDAYKPFSLSVRHKNAL